MDKRKIDNFNWAIFYILLIMVVLFDISELNGIGLTIALLSVSYVKLKYIDPIIKKINELEGN